MDGAKCLVRDNITINIEASFEVNFENGEQKSIECFADNVKFTCVWQQPEVNMHFINQIMNQINVFHDNDYDDCTISLSNITALISSSFPSCETLNELNNDDNDEGRNHHHDDDVIGNDITAAAAAVSFVASTPISTIKTSNEMITSNDNARNDSNDKQRKMLALAFNDTSPIHFQSRQRTLYTKRRLHLS